MKRTPVVGLALVLALLGAARVGATTISAPFLTVGVGDTFAVHVSVTSASDLSFFQFDLGFAPSIVRADTGGASPGAALSSDWFFTSPGAVDNGGGHILGVSASSSFSALSGDGVIADFQFTALSPGVSPLDLSNVFLNLSNTGFQISNGQITVAASVPEPATLSLLAGSFLLLGIRRLLAQPGRPS